MTMYRATTTGIPTKFRPADPEHSPRVVAPGTMSGGDARLDRGGIIHVTYYRTDLRATIYQTFSTVTDTWGPAATVSTFGALRDNPGYGARAAAVNAIALDRVGTSFVVVGDATGARVFRRQPDGTWTQDGDLSSASSLHPAMTFDRQNRLHVAWLEGEHEIRYARRDASGRWAVLGHDDQIHPAYLARVGDMNAWSPVVVFPPTDVDFQYDGSMSARYDPQFEVDCTVIDVVFFDEDSDVRGGFRPDLYYGAIRLRGDASGTASCREITSP